MDLFTSSELAELRRHDLAMDAARIRLAVEARRARPRRRHTREGTMREEKS